MKDSPTQEVNQPGEPTRSAARVTEVAYGLYAWATFLVCVSGAILFALLVPGLSRRRRSVAAAARVWLKLAGIRTRLRGIDSIPETHCVVVANHASYLDGLILQAFLPPRFSFVIKGEMQRVPLVHFFLRRIGSKFVDRFIASASSRDARNLLRAAAAGESLAVFPEGTFEPGPGVQRFRPGAFAAALKGGLPVVPVAIRGSRRILPAQRRLPRYGPLEIEVLAAITPDSDAFADSRTLAETARRAIIAVLDEPDRVRHHEAAGAVTDSRCVNGSPRPGRAR